MSNAGNAKRRRWWEESFTDVELLYLYLRKSFVIEIIIVWHFHLYSQYLYIVLIFLLHIKISNKPKADVIVADVMRNLQVNCEVRGQWSAFFCAF